LAKTKGFRIDGKELARQNLTRTPMISGILTLQRQNSGQDARSDDLDGRVPTGIGALGTSRPTFVILW